jgi:hypothetical protein
LARRYSAESVVDEGAQIERLAYVLSHGVKEGLVSRCQQWPGLSCTQALLEGGSDTVHSWRNWTRRWEMEVEEEVNIDRFSAECPSETEVLELTPLPCCAKLAARERSRLVRQLVVKIDAGAQSPTTADTKHITEQDPHGSPIKTKHSPRPKAHVSHDFLAVAFWDQLSKKGASKHETALPPERKNRERRTCRC